MVHRSFCGGLKMPDYITMFCAQVDHGTDMTDLPWDLWQDIAAKMLFGFDHEELDGVTIQ
jgi:hypothetical protein